MKKLLMLLAVVFFATVAYGDKKYTTEKTVSWWEQVTITNVDLTGYKGQKMQLSGTNGTTFLLNQDPAPFKSYTGSGSNYTVILDTSKVTPNSSTNIEFVAQNGPGTITLTVPPLVPTPEAYGKLKLIPTGPVQPPADSTFSVRVGDYNEFSDVKLNTEIPDVPVGENMQIKITGPSEYEVIPSLSTVTIKKGETTDVNVSFEEAPESNYIIGTWIWTNWNKQIPNYQDYSVLMFGMITNLDDLTTGGGTFGPKKTGIPDYLKSGFSGEVLWTYGGEGALPKGSPTSEAMVSKIQDVTVENNWGGIDIDDEFDGNTANLVKVLENNRLDGKISSFTFLAGYNYTAGLDKVIDDKIDATKNYCDRYVLMCYGNAMWSDADMKKYIPEAIKRTVDYHKIDPAKVIVGCCVAGLNSTNLGYLINWVKGKPVDGESVSNSYQLGGIFYWRSNGNDLPDPLFQQLITGLGIKQKSLFQNAIDLPVNNFL